jgi:acyl-coenzyme A synthetase/AMP-(fatty) acid ligase
LLIRTGKLKLVRLLNNPIVKIYHSTGGHMITPLPGATKMKPGSASLPFFGSTPIILNPKTGVPIEGSAPGALVYSTPWPGIAQTVFGDHQRYTSLPNPLFCSCLLCLGLLTLT